jgi:hypothetical protein
MPHWTEKRYSHPGRDFKGRGTANRRQSGAVTLAVLCHPPPPKTWQTGKLIFFLTQAACLQRFSEKTEFANRGKLSGKLAMSFWQAIN